MQGMRTRRHAEPSVRTPGRLSPRRPAPGALRARQGKTSDIASNLFDLYFTPVIAGCHFSETQHLSLSLNVWAPTGYRNAPLFGLDVMARKMFGNGLGLGLVAGTRLQLDKDSGPTADRLDGFRGHDFALGPILTYDRKLADQRSLSLSLHWAPTIASTRRLDSTATFMASAALIV